MRHLRTIILLVIIFALILTGCTGAGSSKRPPTPFPVGIQSLVVVGFRSALERGTSPGVIRSPISGNAFMARVIPHDKAEYLSDRLFERISESGRYDLVSPSQAQGVISSLMAAHPTMSEIELLKKTGKAFSAHAVLVGYIYRWEERVGRDYAVKTPASVAFDLYLIRPGDGAAIWKDRFDMTQKSLSENLLEMDTFLKGHGKWMTADQLAHLGLNRILGGLSDEPPQPDAEPAP